MQRLLHEGEQDLGFRGRCVAMPACPNFRFFRGAVGSQFRFPSDLALPRVGAAARAAGGMPEYGEYPQVPQPPAILKQKRKRGSPWAARAGTGWAPAALGRGYPLGHADPSPAVAWHRLNGWTALHHAARHGHLPAVHALINAGAPLDVQEITRWALLGGGAGRRARPKAAGGVGGGPVPPPMPPPPAG